MRVLPVLFNTEMVRAILDGRKTVTRRVVKPQMDVCPSCRHIHADYIYDRNAGNIYCASCGEPFHPEIKPLYQTGDILYVRESWRKGYEEGTYIYKADDKLTELPTFKESSKLIYRPSIHMPKEAARIWLKVTDVRVERLHDITEEQAMKEGFSGIRCSCGRTACVCTDCYNSGWIEPLFVGFMYTWDSTIRKADVDHYGWAANPWVWVIEFERCEKPKENEAAGSPGWKDNFMRRFCKIN